MTTRPNTIFQCPITVSGLSSVSQKAQNFEGGNARVAAASIALLGRYTNPGGRESPAVWQQYQLYPWGKITSVVVFLPLNKSLKSGF